MSVDRFSYGSLPISRQLFGRDTIYPRWSIALWKVACVVASCGALAASVLLAWNGNWGWLLSGLAVAYVAMGRGLFLVDNGAGVGFQQTDSEGRTSVDITNWHR